MMLISWRERFLHLAPTKNLVTNIGYRPDATHTSFESPLADLPRNELKDFKVDLEVCALPQIDNLTFYVRFLESLRSVWWLQQALSRPRVTDVDGQLDRIEQSNQRIEQSNRRIATVLQHLDHFSHRIEALEASNQRIQKAQQCLYVFNKIFSPLFALQRWLANEKN